MNPLVKINPKLLTVCNKSESTLVANIHINMAYIVKSHSLNQPTWTSWTWKCVRL